MKGFSQPALSRIRRKALTKPLLFAIVKILRHLIVFTSPCVMYTQACFTTTNKRILSFH